MDSLFFSTSDTVAPLRLRKIEEKSPTPWYNEHTRAPKESSPENGAQLEENKTRGISYCMAGKYLILQESTLSYRKALQTARSDYFASLLEENKHNPRYYSIQWQNIQHQQVWYWVISPQQHSSNDFINYFTSKTKTIRDQTVNHAAAQLQYHIK